MRYLKFDSFVLLVRFLRSKSNHCVYYKFDNDCILIIALYVDNMLLIRNDKNMIFDLKSQFAAQFEMKNLGAARYILGMEIRRDRVNRKLWLS